VTTNCGTREKLSIEIRTLEKLETTLTHNSCQT